MVELGFDILINQGFKAPAALQPLITWKTLQCILGRYGEVHHRAVLSTIAILNIMYCCQLNPYILLKSDMHYSVHLHEFDSDVMFMKVRFSQTLV